MPGVSVPQVSGTPREPAARPSGAGEPGARADRQARAGVATLQVVTGVLVAVAVAVGGIGVLVAVVAVQVTWVVVAGRLLGVAYSGRTLIGLSALLATVGTVWQVPSARGGAADAGASPEALGVLAGLLGLVVVAALFVQLARRDGRDDLTLRLAGTVLVAVLGIVPAALLSVTGSAAGRAALVVMAIAVLVAGAATGLGAGALGSGGLGSGDPGPVEPGSVDPGSVDPGRANFGRGVRSGLRRLERAPVAVRSLVVGSSGAVVCAIAGAVAVTVPATERIGVRGTGSTALAGAVAVYAVLGVLCYLTSLAAGTVARATPSTRTGGLVAAVLAVALATPLVLVATRLVR
jgi:hypothetical protein